MRLQVYRTNSSSYQDKSFFELEKRVLESLEGVFYASSVSEIELGPPMVLITNTHTRPEELPEALLQHTALLIHPNSGCDNFSKSFVDAWNFPMIAGNPIRANAVAEYVLGCLFSRFTPIANHAYWSADRKWDRKLLRDQNVLILGMGMIGKILFQALSPLCARVEAVDPCASKPFGHSNIRKGLSDELLTKADILLVCASLTKTSAGLLNEQTLKKLPPEAVIVNAARGEIVVEKDLALWLKKNEKARAFLDVFEKEPFEPGHLSELSNLTKTSHIAGSHARLNEDIVRFERDVLRDFCLFRDKRDMEGFLAKYKGLTISKGN